MLELIEILGRVNNGKSDRETHKLIKETVDAIVNKERQTWPSKELRAHYNSLDKLQQKLALEVLNDMLDGLNEAYGDLI